MFPLLNGAKVFKNNLFFLKFFSIKQPSRYCFSVSKKTAKSAVVRNRLRRAGYKLLEKHLPEIKINILALFSFRKVPKDNEEIAKNIESILKESKIIK